MGEDETNTWCDTQKKVHCMIAGGLSEWFKELVLKTCEGSSPSVGSNPTPSFEKFDLTLDIRSKFI